MPESLATEGFLALPAQVGRERMETVKICADLDIFLYFPFGSQQSQSRNVPVLKVVEFYNENVLNLIFNIK